MIKKFLVLSMCTVFLFGCKDKVKPGESEVKRQVVRGLTTQEVQITKVEDFYETTGTIKSRQISTVSGRIMGSVRSINVKEGEIVKRGQLLMTIDDNDLSERVKAAQKAVEAAAHNRSLMEITYRRYKGMYDERALSGQELDQIETQKKVAELEYERAKAMLAEAQTYQGFSRITAPISGVVSSKKIDTGSMAVPGAPFFIIEGTDSYHVEVAVDEGLSGKIKAGMLANIYVDSLNREYKGRVSEVVQSVDPQSRSFIVKIPISGTGIRSGSFARVKIPIGMRDTFLAPTASVVQKGQLMGLYTVDNKGVITYRLIKQGKRYADAVEVLSGLNAGDRIVIGGIDKVVDGGVIAGAKEQ